MALSYKARRRWALFILVIGLPLYIAMAWWLSSTLERPNILIEIVIYLVLGVIWMVPLKFIFKGIGQGDPDAKD